MTVENKREGTKKYRNTLGSLTDRHRSLPAVLEYDMDRQAQLMDDINTAQLSHQVFVNENVGFVLM